MLCGESTSFVLLRGINLFSVYSDSEWLNYAAYISVFIMTNISTMIKSWSVMTLLIDSYRINHRLTVPFTQQETLHSVACLSNSFLSVK